MIVYIATHVPFEGPAMIADLLESHGHRTTEIALHRGESPPPAAEVAAWISMGGPMSVHDRDEYPWIAAEQALMRELHRLRRPLLGVCLGAQQIGTALGAQVDRSPEPEIGWYPLAVTPAWRQLIGAPPTAPVLHWHGEMVTTPDGAHLLANTPGCPHQGFLFPDRPTCGLQFHLEMDAPAVDRIVEHGGNDLAAHRGAPFVQEPDRIRLAAPSHAPVHRRALDTLLRRLGL